MLQHAHLDQSLVMDIVASTKPQYLVVLRLPSYCFDCIITIGSKYRLTVGQGLDRQYRTSTDAKYHWLQRLRQSLMDLLDQTHLPLLRRFERLTLQIMGQQDV